MTARKQARRMLLAALTSAPLLSSTIAYGDSSATGKPSLPAHRNTPAAQSTATGSTASGSAANSVKPTPGSVKPGSNGLRPVPVPTDAPAGVVPQVQQVQYQNKNQAQTQAPPQSSAASNGNVEAELNKLFRESGQEPPSMKSKDLPYANTPQMDKVRPKPQTQQPANQTAQQQPAKKKNVFQKFFGKLSGKNEETSTAEAPKPPELKTAPTAQAGTVQPKAGQAGSVQPRVGQAGTVQPRPGQQSGGQPLPGQPSPAQPGMMRSASASQGQPQVRQPAARPQQFAQPGSAPAFMNGGGARPVQSATPVQPSTLSQPRTAPTPVPAVPAAQAVPAEPRRQPVDDQFVDPFDGGSEPESDEELDLDSLLEIPQTPVSQPEAAAPAIAVPATEVPSVEVPTTGAPEVEIPTPRAAAPVANPFEAIEVPGPTPEEVSVSPRTSVPEESAAAAEETAEGTEASAAPPVENPFTGVKLNVTDEEFFGGDSTGRATIENSGDDDDDLDESEGDDDSEMDGETFGTPLPPVEEFSEDIPSIEISTPATTPAPQNRTNGAPNAAPAVLPIPRQQHSMDAEQLQQTAEQVRRERQRRAIMSRPNMTGFKGFCPVELRDHRELVDTRPEFTATFGLQTYQFSSAQAKAAFESDPSRYAPAAGGSDVVLLVNTGEEQPGTLEYSLWYRDRLYLFRSRETMSLFSQDPSRFANQY